MVIQCERPIVVWGSGKPGDNVQISIDTSRASAIVNSSGHFKAVLSALRPSGNAVRCEEFTERRWFSASLRRVLATRKRRLCHAGRNRDLLS